MFLKTIIKIFKFKIVNFFNILFSNSFLIDYKVNHYCLHKKSRKNYPNTRFSFYLIRESTKIQIGKQLRSSK